MIFQKRMWSLRLGFPKFLEKVTLSFGIQVRVLGKEPCAL